MISTASNANNGQIKSPGMRPTQNRLCGGGGVLSGFNNLPPIVPRGSTAPLVWLRSEIIRHRSLELRSQGVALKAMGPEIGVPQDTIEEQWTKIGHALGNNDPFYIAFWWYKRQAANNGNKTHEASRDISDSRDGRTGARVGNQSICR